MTPRMSLVAVCCSSAIAQLAVARLHLLEQPRVLDGDHRLVGEGLEQLDLGVGERDRIAPYDVDGTDRRVAFQHRHRQARAVPDGARTLGTDWIGDAVLRVGQGDHPALEQRARRHGAPAGRGRIGAADERRRLWGRAAVGGHRDHLAVETEHDAVETVAQPRRALRDHVEHGLHIGGRAADDVEHLARRGLILQGLPAARACSPAPPRTAAYSRWRSRLGRRR